MAQLRATASAEIPAPSDVVYTILTDYHDAHPSILPKWAFLGIEIERGGIGAGTVIRVRVRTATSTRIMRLEVSEPDPGHILAETDSDTGMVTTFTVEPLAWGRHSRVEIVTRWESHGIKGIIERLTLPMMRRVYGEELRNLANVAVTRAGKFTTA